MSYIHHGKIIDVSGVVKRSSNRISETTPLKAAPLEEELKKSFNHTRAAYMQTLRGRVADTARQTSALVVTSVTYMNSRRQKSRDVEKEQSSSGSDDQEDLEEDDGEAEEAEEEEKEAPHAAQVAASSEASDYDMCYNEKHVVYFAMGMPGMMPGSTVEQFMLQRIEEAKGATKKKLQAALTKFKRGKEKLAEHMEAVGDLAFSMFKNLRRGAGYPDWRYKSRKKERANASSSLKTTKQKRKYQKRASVPVAAPSSSSSSSSSSARVTRAIARTVAGVTKRKRRSQPAPALAAAATTTSVTPSGIFLLNSSSASPVAKKAKKSTK